MTRDGLPPDAGPRSPEPAPSPRRARRPRAVPPPAGEQGAAEPFGLASLPFDLYQPRKLAQEAIERLRDGRRRLTILDVGGAPGHLRRFLPRDQVVVLDREGGPGDLDVRGDEIHLPFPDRAFDVVVAIDALDRTPARRRPALLRELGRVAGDAALVFAPFAAPRVDEAESILAAFFQRRLGLEAPRLELHRRLGLPDRARTQRRLERQVGPVVAVPNGNLDRWLLMSGLLSYLRADPSLADVTRQVSAYYNRNHYRGDNSEPAYRWLLAARREPGAPLDPRGLGPPEGEPARLDFAPMAALIEVTGIDLLREAHRSIETLQSQLGDKDVRAAGLRAERDHRQRMIEALQAEIAGRQSRIDELRAAIDSKEEALEERGRRIVEIHREIEQLRRAQGEVVSLREDLERERSAGADLREHARDLASALRRQVDGMEGIRVELARFADLAEGLRARDRRIGDLEAEVVRLEAEHRRRGDLDADLRQLSATLAARGEQVAALERREEERARDLDRVRAGRQDLDEHVAALKRLLERRRTDADRLAALVAERGQRIERLTDLAGALEQDREQASAAVEALRADLSAREQGIADLEGRMNALQDRAFRLGRQVQVLCGVVDTRQQSVAEVNAQAYRFQHERDRLRADLDEARRWMQSARDEIAARGRALKELRDAVARQLRAASGLRERAEAAEEIAGREERAASAAAGRAERAEKSAVVWQQAMQVRDARVAGLREQAAALEARIHEEENRARELRATLDASRRELDALRARLRERSMAASEAAARLETLRRSRGVRLVTRIGLVRE